jgi:hypothetical protein
MIGKKKLGIGPAVCTGLLIVLVLGFAHVIAGAVMASPKLQSQLERNIRPLDPGCARAPWPFGCDWGVPTGRRKIVRKSGVGHGHHAHTAMRQGQALLGSKL